MDPLQFFKAVGARIVIEPFKRDDRNGHFNPNTDTIHVAKPSLFRTPELFWGTVAHETIHLTGSPRIRRSPRPWPEHHDLVYAREEIIAEIGAAFLCNALDVYSPEVEARNLDYIAYWAQQFPNSQRELVVLQARDTALKAIEFLADRVAASRVLVAA